MSQIQSKEVVVGKITSVFGVKGWVKVYSYTDPIAGILTYPTWFLSGKGCNRIAELAEGKVHGKGLVARLKGVDDRAVAAELSGLSILVSENDFAKLGEGEYYWRDLIGLTVETLSGIVLGKVSSLMETGSNDVLVINEVTGGSEGRERLIPYRPEVVLDINLECRTMKVDWDPEF